MEANKENFKKLITNNIVLLADGIEPLQNSTDDILQELTKSIGQIDFMLLAFPESEAVLNRYNALRVILEVLRGAC